MADGEHALADELGLEPSSSEVTFEGIRWFRDDGEERRGPYQENLGVGPECWTCFAVPSIKVVNYCGRHSSSIFSGWRVLSGGCGVSGTINELIPCLEAANRHAAQCSRLRVREAERELDEANAADKMMATIEVEEA